MFHWSPLIPTNPTTLAHSIILVWRFASVASNWPLIRRNFADGQKFDCDPSDYHSFAAYSCLSRVMWPPTCRYRARHYWMVELPGLILETVWQGISRRDLRYGFALSTSRATLLKDFLLSGLWHQRCIPDFNRVFCFWPRSGVTRLSDYCLGLSGSFPVSETSNSF